MDHEAFQKSLVLQSQPERLQFNPKVVARRGTDSAVLVDRKLVSREMEGIQESLKTSKDDLVPKNEAHNFLHLAAARGEVKTIADLEIKNRKLVMSLVNEPDNMGRTALHHAAERGHAEMALFLVQKCKARVNLADHHGRTPLWYAAYRGHCPVVQLLVSKCRAKTNIADNRGRTPLYVASLKRHAAVRRYLIKDVPSDFF